MKCVTFILSAAASIALAQHDYDPSEKLLPQSLCPIHKSRLLFAAECSVAFGNSTFNLNAYTGLDLADIEDAE